MFKTLSPIHIGSGDVYPDLLLYANKRYDLSQFLHSAFQNTDKKREILSSAFLKSFGNSYSRDNRNGILIPTAAQVATMVPSYSVLLDPRDQNKIGNTDVCEFVKTMGVPYIPGSTIKGYIIKVILYDLVATDPLIKDMLKKELKICETKSDYSLKSFARFLSDRMFTSCRPLICRDVLFHHDVKIHFIGQNFRRNGNLMTTVQTVEFLEGDSESDDDAISIDERMINNWPKLAEDIERRESEKFNQGPSKNATTDEKYKQEKHKANMEDFLYFVGTFYKRIDSLKQNFAVMNERFMRGVIEAERHFIDSTKKNRDKILVSKITDQLNQIESRLQSGEIVMQIGRFTNYLAKSIGKAFDDETDFYESKFNAFFSPRKGITGTGLIGTMGLIAEPGSGMLGQIPGFISFRW